MLISNSYDHARQKDREQRYKEALRTADKLHARVKIFFDHIRKDSNLNATQKKAVIERMLHDL